MTYPTFASIPYVRPDYSAYRQAIEDCARKIRTASSIQEISAALTDFFSQKIEAETNETLAFIRYYQDSSDQASLEEMQYTQTQAAETDISPIYDALLDSPFRAEIDGAYGEQFMRKAEKERLLTQSGLEFLSREQELIARYQNAFTAMRFSYNGREVTAAELSGDKCSADASVRKQARDAARQAFAERGGEFLDILEELVEVRAKIAHENGFPNYLEYANTEKGRYTYGENELAQVCAFVREELVPLKKRLYERLRERLDLTDYTADDTGVYFKEGNPKPLGGAEFLLEQGSKMYERMDPEFSALFEVMKNGGYIDCASSPNKITGMGFCTQIYAARLPFIFGNCVGKYSDADILVHEFGHAVQMKMSMDRYALPEYWDMPNDLSELPSKAMEQLVYEYAPLFFGERSPQYLETHLITILEEICAFCLTHEFETYLYSGEAFDREEAVAVYNRLTRLYDDGVNYSGCASYIDAGALLVQNKGIYMFPRYLISYTLSDIAAVSIRLAYERDLKKGLAIYKNLCSLGGSRDYGEALREIGLALPYMREAVAGTKAYLAEKLALAE